MSDIENAHRLKFEAAMKRVIDLKTPSGGPFDRMLLSKLREDIAVMLAEAEESDTATLGVFDMIQKAGPDGCENYNYRRSFAVSRRSETLRCVQEWKDLAEQLDQIIFLHNKASRLRMEKE